MCFGFAGSNPAPATPLLGRLLIAVALAALVAPDAARAALSIALPPRHHELRVERARGQSCRAPVGGSGVATVGWTAPRAGTLTATLAAAAGDWDLVLLDARSGRPLGASLGFGARERAGAPVHAGQRVRVQACRRAGPARRAALRLGLSVVDDLPPAERASLVAVDVAGGRRAMQRLLAAGLDLAEDTDRRRVDVVLHGAADRRRLAATGLPARVRIADLAAHERARPRPNALRPRAARSGLPSGRSEYRGPYSDYQAELKALVAEHPGLVRPVALPERSVLGAELSGVEVARDVERADDGRPVLLVVGAHHAREWPSAEIAQELALDLARRHAAGDLRVRALLARLRVVVVPVVNPDGYDSSRAFGYRPGLDDDREASRRLAAAGAEAYRRKSCRDDPADPAAQSDPCPLLAGVDLNRNYAAGWGGNGAGRTFASPTFRGPVPFSEPEARAVRGFSSRRQVTTLITLHNYAGLVLRPPGVRALGRAPDERRLRRLADRMAAATGYRSQRAYELYEATGATDDWSYAAQGAFGLTVEVGGDNFHVDYQDGVIDEYLGTADGPLNRRPRSPDHYTIRPTGRGLREALLIAAEQAADRRDHALLTGRAPPGRLLRLRKVIRTATSPVSARDGDPAPGPALRVRDRLESTLRVPVSGRLSWHVNPSTRPFQRAAGRREAWTLTCEAAGGRVLRRSRVEVDRGRALRVSPCPRPRGR